MISRKDMMLKPRQRPKRPPREAMKSTGPILMLLSISWRLGKLNSNYLIWKMWSFERTILTHHSVLAKEDIDNSNVLLPGVVEVVLEFKDRAIHSVMIWSPLPWWPEGCPCASFSLGSPLLPGWRCRKESNRLNPGRCRAPVCYISNI